MSKSSEIAIVLLGLFSMALSMPAALQKRNSDNDVQLLKYHDERNVDGSYEYKWDKEFKKVEKFKLTTVKRKKLHNSSHLFTCD